MNIIDIAEALNLTTIGPVFAVGQHSLSSAVEIENRLGRAWMVFSCYPHTSMLPDLFFLSYSPVFDRFSPALGSFMAIANLTSLKEAAERFKDQSSDWDIQYLQSVVRL
jgi:hypothetical protein